MCTWKYFSITFGGLQNCGLLAVFSLYTVVINRKEITSIYKFPNYVEILDPFYLQGSFNFGVHLMN